MRILEKQDITFHNKKYELKLKPYRLVVEDFGGTVFLETEVFSYCDCFAYEMEFLFWGDRMGKIHCVDFNNKEKKTEFFISKEAEKFYAETTGLNSIWDYVIKNHLLGDYGYLPELYTANHICSKLAISAMTSYEQNVVIGDLSGRIAVFDITKQAIVTNWRVPGPVANLEISGDKILIDYAIVERDVESPDYLKDFKPLTRLEYGFDSILGN